MPIMAPLTKNIAAVGCHIRQPLFVLSMKSDIAQFLVRLNGGYSGTCCTCSSIHPAIETSADRLQQPKQFDHARPYS
jgi:hypothetical protein